MIAFFVFIRYKNHFSWISDLMRLFPFYAPFSLALKLIFLIFFLFFVIGLMNILWLYVIL